MDSIWHSMFIPGLSVAEKIIRPLIVYVFLIIGLRLSGKRELAQLNPFDLVVLLILSNTVQNAIIGNDNSVTGGLIGATTLLVLNYIVLRFMFSHERLERIVEGEQDALIENGVLKEERLKKELTMFPYTHPRVGYRKPPVPVQSMMTILPLCACQAERTAMVSFARLADDGKYMSESEDGSSDANISIMRLFVMRSRT